jgi:hypothetical protein
MVDRLPQGLGRLSLSGGKNFSIKKIIFCIYRGENTDSFANQGKGLMSGAGESNFFTAPAMPNPAFSLLGFPASTTLPGETVTIRAGAGIAFAIIAAISTG